MVRCRAIQAWLTVSVFSSVVSSSIRSSKVSFVEVMISSTNNLPWPKWLLAVFLGFELIHLCEGQCPENYKSMGGMCIKYTTTKMTFDKAMANCQSDSAILFPKIDKNEWELMIQTMDSSQLASVWIGLRYNNVTLTWSWADGTPFDPATDWAPWNKGEPAPTDKNQCVVPGYDMKGTKSTGWLMTSCANGFYPVCVKTAVTTTGTGSPMTFPTYANVTCPPGFISGGGQCFRFNKDQISYMDATAVCASNGSQLLFCKDESMWKYAEYYFGEMLEKGWFGLAYNTATQQFEWADGTVYKSTDWSAWCDGMPGTPDSWNGDCVNIQTVYETGEQCWYMVDCSDGKQAVCLYAFPTTTPMPTTTVPTTTTTAAPTTTTVATTTTTEPPTTTTTEAPTTTTTEAATTTSTPMAPTTTAASTSGTAASTLAATTGASDSSTTGSTSSADASTSTPSMSGAGSTSTTSTGAGQSSTTTAASTSGPSATPTTTATGQSSTSTTAAPPSTTSTAVSMTTPPATSPPSPTTPRNTTGFTRPASLTGCKPSSTGSFSPLITHGYLSFTPLQSISAKVNTECATACLQSIDCGSFDWNGKTGECRLHWEQFTQDCKEFVQNADFEHFDLMKVEQACYC